MKSAAWFWFPSHASFFLPFFCKLDTETHPFAPVPPIPPPRQLVKSSALSKTFTIRLEGANKRHSRTHRVHETREGMEMKNEKSESLAWVKIANEALKGETKKKKHPNTEARERERAHERALEKRSTEIINLNNFIIIMRELLLLFY